MERLHGAIFDGRAMFSSLEDVSAIGDYVSGAIKKEYERTKADCQHRC